jgi:hypothetical protein
MAGQTTYYAIIDHRSTREDPAGIARRRPLEAGGFRDEALDRNMNWQFTPVIVEWKRAESTDDLVEINADEAERIIERFRAKCGAEG